MTVEWLKTQEELDALPKGTVIRSRRGQVSALWNDGNWYTVGSDSSTSDLEAQEYRWHVIYAPPVTEVVWDTTVTTMPFVDFPSEAHATIPFGSKVRVTVTVIDEDRWWASNPADRSSK